MVLIRENLSLNSDTIEEKAALYMKEKNLIDKLIKGQM